MSTTYQADVDDKAGVLMDPTTIDRTATLARWAAQAAAHQRRQRFLGARSACSQHAPAAPTPAPTAPPTAGLPLAVPCFAARIAARRRARR